MPVPITPVAAWTTPLNIMADGDLVELATHEPAFQAVADRLELLKTRALGGVTAWPVAVTIHVAGVAFAGQQVGVAAYWGKTSSATSGHPHAAIASASGAEGPADITPRLRTGMKLSSVTVKVQHPACTVAPKVKVWRVNNSTGVATQMGTTQSGTLGSGTDSIAVAFTTHDVDTVTNSYFVVVAASDNAAPGGIPDERILGADLAVSDETLRNF